MANATGANSLEPHRGLHFFTLRCVIPAGSHTLEALKSAISQVGGCMGPLAPAAPKTENKTRDVNVHLSNEGQVDKLLQMITPMKDLQIAGVTDEVLEMHKRGVIKVVSSVPIKTLTDLRRVYTPGVASALEKAAMSPTRAWEITGICDRIAIVTNGTAVLGFGKVDLIPALTVMNGKAAILAEFVGISGFPILVDSEDVDTIVETVALTASGYGAIQLEDIAAPACFEIEENLKARLNIPVFHDDQHGTATVVLAAVMNALRRTGRKAADCSVLMLGAGAAGYAVTLMLLEFGIGNIVVYDSKGPIYRGRRESMNPYKQHLAAVTNKDNEKGTLSEGFVGKSIFIGVSRPNMITSEMVASMAKHPIVFPLSNPVGEISKEEAIDAGAAVAADGRDINNALAYPGIFRGALDAKATEINGAMKLAAAQELAGLTPPNELLPDVLDRSVHKKVAQAVAKAWQKEHNRS